MKVHGKLFSADPASPDSVIRWLLIKVKLHLFLPGSTVSLCNKLDSEVVANPGATGAYRRCRICVQRLQRVRHAPSDVVSPAVVEYWRLSSRTPEEVARDQLEAKRRVNRRALRRKHLRDRYKIGMSEYSMMFAQQNYRCAICKKEPPTGTNLDVDHDHKTAKVRGLLCRDCNVGIARLGDDIEGVRRALVYLRENG